jgi:hypothetical protein
MNKATRERNAKAATTTTMTSSFNYDLQVWIVNGRVKECGHPARMRLVHDFCCNAWRYSDWPESAAIADAIGIHPTPTTGG